MDVRKSPFSQPISLMQTRTYDLRQFQEDLAALGGKNSAQVRLGIARPSVQGQRADLAFSFSAFWIAQANSTLS